MENLKFGECKYVNCLVLGLRYSKYNKCLVLFLIILVFIGYVDRSRFINIVYWYIGIFCFRKEIRL